MTVVSRLKWLSIAACCTLAFSVKDLSAAVSIVNGMYIENFNAPLDTNAWTLSNLAVANYVDGGRSTVTVAASAGDGMVAPGTNPSAVPPPGVNNGDSLSAIKAAGSFASYGFSGSWLVNDAEMPGGLNNTLSQTRSATLSLTDLGAHTSIQSISFLLAAGDSIDNDEGVFEVYIDGGATPIFRRDFESGGALRTATPVGEYVNIGTGITALSPTQSNLKGDGFYREVWQANAATTANRNAESWTLETAYKIDLQNIAHTSDDLTLTFVWRGFNSRSLDEFLAIDNLAVVVPEPSRALLLLGALGTVGFTLSRRRGIAQQAC